jgi:hypothetical protein
MQQNSNRLQDEGKPILGNMNRLWGKTELELGRTETEPGNTEPSSDKERLVLGNTNQLPGNIDRLSGKVIQEQSQTRVRWNWDRVVKSGYGKK